MLSLIQVNAEFKFEIQNLTVGLNGGDMETKIMVRAVVGLVSLVLSGCATTTLVSTWDDPAYTQKIDKILVLGMSKNEGIRTKYEHTLATAIKAQGALSEPAAAYLPGNVEPTRESVQAAIAGKGFDTVLVTRVISATTEKRYVPGTPYVVPAPYYNGFYDYYLQTFPIVYSPGYVVNDKVVNLETNIYDIESGKLVWAVVSESFNPENLDKEIDALAELIVTQLKKDGML